MKHSAVLTRLVSASLLACMLLSLASCKTPSSDQNSDSTESQTPETPYERPVYEDLSMTTVPEREGSSAKSYTVQAKGSGQGSQIVLDFTKETGVYMISPTKVNFSCHDVATCDSCGYTATDAGDAYLMSSQGVDQGCMTVTLAAPILASSVQGMTLTFRTTKNAKSSAMRILTAAETNNAAFINTCPSMADAVSEWRTIDLGVSDFAKLADDDGYIRAFQMCFRNKDGTDCYVQSVTFAVGGAEQLLCIDRVSGNSFFRGGAVEAVAAAIAKRFEDAGISAEITVNSKRYRDNSSASEGYLNYGATAVLEDGTKITASYEAVIPAVSGVWLDHTDGKYGSAHNSREQWQQTFDQSGMLFLTDNQISCAEGVARMEYAVIAADGAFDDATIAWQTPQLLQMSDDGFSHLFINAPLDLYGTLTEGQSYRLLVRGVSYNQNYILHVDIPFTYLPLSVQAESALSAALAKVAQAELACDAATEDKVGVMQAQLSALIADPSIAVQVNVLGMGVHSMRLSVGVRYVSEIQGSRLPEYVLDGERITDVYNFAGESFATDAATVRYGDAETEIALLTPYDGDAQVILANEYIYNHAKAPLAQIESVSYGYVRAESCTPVPVVLTWTDEAATAGKEYTVRISESSDMRDPLALTVAQTRAEVYNLKIGTQYYWQVEAGGVKSLVHTFATEDGYPRFIKMDGVSNVRDIGGYVTLDGKRVKQGLAYRSAHLDGITEQGLDVALDQLGIRTDLDLRGGSTKPLGDSVNHVSIAMQWYEHIFEKNYHADVCEAIRAFAYEENYPILFHCSMGRDRTGTTAFLILGLLGVDEDTLRHEYYASFFSTQGAFDTEEFPLLIANVNRLVKELNKFGDKDDSLQEKIEAYMLSIGITEQEIANIRAIWLEE